MGLSASNKVPLRKFLKTKIQRINKFFVYLQVNLNKKAMTKYFFIKPFSTQIVVGGVVGISTYSKNKGDAVEGIVVNDKNGGEQQLKVEINKFPIQGAQTHVYIPMSFLTADSYAVLQNKNSEPNSLFTTKNIVIGVGAIVVFLGVLKVTKVI
jgi:hypothetical protein